MGECFISRRGGEVNKLPVLNENYPEDASVMQSIGGAVGFSILILEHGRPAEYTYQWYVNGIAVDGATSATYIKNTESAGICTIYCEITNKAGTVTSRIATLSVESSMPTYSYNGNVSHVSEDENNVNWNLNFLSSGTFYVDRDVMVDIHMVGGGGAGGFGVYQGERGAGGGGGGYTNTQKRVTLTAGTEYTVTIGAGGSRSAYNGEYSHPGGTTSAFGYSASGGKAGVINGGSAAAGGAAGGTWSSKGADGTHAFNDPNFPIYGGGGGGGGSGWGAEGASGGAGGGGKGGRGWRYETAGEGNGTSGGTNTGGGGGGAGSQAGGNGDGGGVSYVGGNGGSGIVIIRNAR